MDKNYFLERSTVVEILNDIEVFLDKLESYKDELPNLKYRYDIKINELEDKRWQAKINFERDEK